MAPRSGHCRIAGVDLATLGWRFLRAPEIRSLPSSELIHRPVPGRSGLMRTGRRTPVARQLVLQGWLDSRMRSGIEEARDALLGLAASGPVTIEVGTRPGVAWVGELVSSQVAEFGPQLNARHPSLTLTFSCANPYALDLEPRVVGWTSATDPAVVECGTGPSDLTVRLVGPAVNPDVLLLDCRGLPVSALYINTALGVDEWLVISAETFRVTRVASGVITDAASVLADGSRFLSVDPSRDADPAAGAWPTVHSTSGTGSVVYRRHWL